MTDAELLIDQYLEFKRMGASQRMRMARSRKKPKSAAHKMGLRKRRKVAKKGPAKMKAKKYRRRTKSFRR